MMRESEETHKQKEGEEHKENFRTSTQTVVNSVMLCTGFM